MGENMSRSLVFPLINSNRRQSGGDEGDYYVLDHVLVFKFSGCRVVKL